MNVNKIGRRLDRAARNTNNPATIRQRSFLATLMHRAGLDATAEVFDLYDNDATLTFDDAHRLIEHFLGKRAAQAA